MGYPLVPLWHLHVSLACWESGKVAAGWTLFWKIPVHFCLHQFSFRFCCLLYYFHGTVRRNKFYFYQQETCLWLSPQYWNGGKGPTVTAESLHLVSSFSMAVFLGKEILTSGVAAACYCSRSRCSVTYRPLSLPPWSLRGQIHHPPLRGSRLFPQPLPIAEGLERHAIGVVTYWPQTCMTRSI